MAKTKTISKGCPKCEQQVILYYNNYFIFIPNSYTHIYINFMLNIFCSFIYLLH